MDYLAKLSKRNQQHTLTDLQRMKEVEGKTNTGTRSEKSERSERSTDGVVVEPAIKPDGTPLTPVYWERSDGSISGPAPVDFFYQMGSTDGLIVTYRGELIWINANRLRSRKAFLEQPEVREVDPAWRW